MKQEEIVDNLLKIYESIFKEFCSDGKPDWAVRKKSNPDLFVHPTIPFVGKNYFGQNKKILIYASAENLSQYQGHLDEDTVAKNRHRHYFSKPSKTDFPFVHIQPIQDGCLMNVLRYVCEKLEIAMPEDPREFLENIAFANFCKYSIQSGRNVDYASNAQYLEFSLNYVTADLDSLKPDIIIMPRTIFRVEKSFIREHSPESKIFPIMQINARNINCRIAPKYKRKDQTDLSSVTRKWYEKLGKDNNSCIKGKTKENFLSVYTYLDEIITENMK